VSNRAIKKRLVTAATSVFTKNTKAADGDEAFDEADGSDDAELSNNSNDNDSDIDIDDDDDDDDDSDDSDDSDESSSFDADVRALTGEKGESYMASKVTTTQRR
jgi:hypothetical protein